MGGVLAIGQHTTGPADCQSAHTLANKGKRGDGSNGFSEQIHRCRNVENRPASVCVLLAGEKLCSGGSIIIYYQGSQDTPRLSKVAPNHLFV